MTGEAGVRTALVAVALVAAGIGPAAAQGVPSQIVSPDPSTAQASATQAFDIPPQPLGTALVRFSEATGIQLFFDATLARGLQSPGVSGSMTRQDALGRLLAGSGLVYRFTNATTVAVERPGASGASPGAVQLDPVQVQAFAVPPQAMIDNIPPPYAGGQVATGAQLGILGNRDVMDTPFNQTSYTAKKAQDQQAQTLRDVLVDDPSVQVMSANRGVDGDNIRIRGFDLFASSVAYGGLYGILPSNSIMVELAERIEVLKGPSAMLNGMQPGGNIGGTVNVVPKRASAEPLTQFTAAYNSNAQFGGAVDVSRRLGPDKQFGVRFNGVYRAGQTDVEWTTDKSALAVLGLDFRGERVRLSADLGYQYQYLGGVVPAAPLAPGVSLPWAPNASSNFGQPWNYKETKDVFGVIRGEVDLTERVTAYASLGAHDNRQMALWAVNALVTNTNGNAISTPVAQGNYQKTLTGEAGVRARAETGPIDHEIVFAATGLEQENGGVFDIGAGFATNIFNPTLMPRANLLLPPVNKISTNGRGSLALVDTLSAVDKRIQLTVGLRQQRVTAQNFNSVTGAQTSNYDQSALTPSVALVVKPWWQNVSFYGNFIQGLQQGTTVPTNFTNAGEVFPPFMSTQYEAGVKVNWGKFTTTASLFQITQPTTIVDVTSNTLTLAGAQRNQGLEFNFFGEPVEGARLLGGAMFLNAVLTKTQGGLTDGWIAPLSPNLQLRAAAEWDTPFAPGLTLDGRVLYTASQYIDTNFPRRSIPEWTRFDLGARYVLDNARSPTAHPVAIRFNVENVFDTNYWTAGNWVGAPRTFRLSLTANF